MSSQAQPIDGNVEPAGPVVVGYLQGATGDAALACAAEEARLRQTNLVVMHQLVGAQAPDRYGPDAGSPQPIRAEMDRLLSAAQAAAPDVQHVDVKVITAPIAEELILASATADLIVLGVTTRNRVTAAMFDTVPRTVVRAAHCPVMLVGATGDRGVRLVCGVDRAPASVAALLWAATEAQRRRTSVLVVEVVDRRHPGPEEDLHTWVHRCLPPSEIPITCAQHSGSAANVLTTVAAGQEALLVVGSHNSGSHHPSTVTHSVTAQHDVPVVVVPG
ncbi:MAG TPA: universal stress protein [Mycobacteriales bacterium]|nr:universal stress protein [Mycobacteriales bacterium]